MSMTGMDYSIGGVTGFEPIPEGQTSQSMATVGNEFTAQYDGQCFLYARSAGGSQGYGYIQLNITYPNCTPYTLNSSFYGNYYDYTCAFFVTKGTKIKTSSVTNLQSATLAFIPMRIS